MRALRGENLEPSLLHAEQSNTSLVFGDQLVLKLFRRVEEGENPDLEIGRALTERHELEQRRAAARARSSTGRRAASPSTLALLQQYVPNEGDAWRFTLDSLDRFFEDALAPRRRAAALPIGSLLELSQQEPPQLAHETIGSYLESASAARAAHRRAALRPSTRSTSRPSRPSRSTLLDQRSLYQSMRTLARQVVRHAAAPRSADFPGGAALLEREHEVLERFNGSARPDARRRAHPRARRLPPRAGAAGRARTS